MKSLLGTDVDGASTVKSISMMVVRVMSIGRETIILFISTTD